MLLSIDTHTRQCRLYEIPPALRQCGGRALASLLASGEGGFVGGEEPRVVFAPGLLALCLHATSGRCAVSCYLPGQTGIATSNAGGFAAVSLARCGLRALLLRGTGQGRELFDLLIDKSGGRLVPVPHKESSLTNVVSPTHIMADLSSRWPDAACIICAGKLGRLHIPIANTTFSDANLQPSSHAGSGSGMILGMAGIRSIIILHSIQNMEARQETAAAKMLVSMLAELGKRTGVSCAQRCATQCPGDNMRSGISFTKWPGYTSLWASGDEKTDVVIARQYVSLCDTLQLDSFALATRLKDLVRQEILPAKDSRCVLAALEEMVQKPEQAWLLPWLQGWKPELHPGVASEKRLLIDTLGLCRIASSVIKTEDTLSTMPADMFSMITGLSDSAREMLVNRVLLTEKTYNSSSENESGLLPDCQ
ncbi:MAG: hypothetical protein J5861_03940 [Desulfovibrio sp.]|nr:hypothetical protein [Desulfovibrio sp.]